MCQDVNAKGEIGKVDGQENELFENDLVTSPPTRHLDSFDSSFIENSHALITDVDGGKVWEQALSTFTLIEKNEYRGPARGLATTDESMPCSCRYDAGACVFSK